MCTLQNINKTSDWKRLSRISSNGTEGTSIYKKKIIKHQVPDIMNFKGNIAPFITLREITSCA